MAHFVGNGLLTTSQETPRPFFLTNLTKNILTIVREAFDQLGVDF